MKTLGVDIGGANLKAADSDGRSIIRPFAVWKAPQRLASELEALFAPLLPADVIAVTMTAELADCFQTKSEGIDRILFAVESAAKQCPVVVWQTGAEFVTPQVAREIPLLVAAANWHALATWVARIAAKETAILFDIGSTTADIIPLVNGIPVPRGLTDCQRLQAGELVYSGVRRTPVCAIAHSIPYRDGYCPLAAEIFATSLDIYLLLGDIPENSADYETANGGAATRAAAHDRLARCLCCDRTEFSAEDAETMARFLADVQRQRLTGSLDRVLSQFDGKCSHVLTAGSGAFLADRIVQTHPQLKSASHTPLANMLDQRVSDAACAFAVARLAHERLPSVHDQ